MEYAKKRRSGGFVPFSRLWTFFSSMRVGIILLLILAGFSVFGSLLPHQEAIERVYSSWWFVGVLAALALNLLVCSIWRIRSIWNFVFGSPINVKVGTLRNYHHQRTVDLPADNKQLTLQIRQAFRSRGYRTSVKEWDNGFLVSADKGRCGFLGSFITHLSLIVILAGGLYGTLVGYEYSDTAIPGTIIRIPGEDFSVRIDDFEIAYRDDPHRTIEQYYTAVTVVEGGRAKKRDTIFVNKPLRHRGVNIYQSSYGWGVTVQFVRTDTGQADEMLLSPGQTFRHYGTGLLITLMEFYPDFAVSEEGSPHNRSAFPGNPYVSFGIANSSGEANWSNYLEPLGTSITLNDKYTLELVGYRSYPGLLIVKNPGKVVVLFGSICLIIGLILSFYVFPRTIWAYVIDKASGELCFSGYSYRNKTGFAAEFERVVGEIREGIVT